MVKRQRGKVAHGVVFARGDDEVLGSLLLEDEPHTLDVVLGVAPVAEGVEIAEIEFVLESLCDAAGRQGDLSCHEVLSAPLALVVEEDAVAAIEPVGLAVVLHDPIAVELCHAIGASRIERRGLALRHLLHLSVELGGGRLVDAARLLQSADTDGFEQSQYADSVGLGGIFRHVEAHFDMALCGQVVDLRRLGLADDADERRGVGHVRPVEVHQSLLLHVAHPFVQIEVLDASGVERGAAAQQSMHLIPLSNQKLGQERTVLTRDARDEGHFLFHLIIAFLVDSTSGRRSRPLQSYPMPRRGQSGPYPAILHR